MSSSLLLIAFLLGRFCCGNAPRKRQQTAVATSLRFGYSPILKKPQTQGLFYWLQKTIHALTRRPYWQS